MNSNSAETHILLRIEGTETHQSTIDAPTLVATIEALQRAVYYVAMDCSKRDVAERVRVPNDIARRFSLDCSIAQAGSFAQPMTLGTFAQDVEDRGLIPEVVSELNKCICAVEERNVEHLRNMLHHEELRKRMLKTLSDLIPKANRDYKIYVKLGELSEHTISSSSRSVFATLKQQVEREESYLTVTGRLHSIDFSENRIRIFYPGNQKELDCIYDPAIEDLLLDNPRDWIQVSGTVVMGDDEEPKKIIDVDSICELDMTEIVVREVQAGEETLSFRPPLRFSPSSTESKQLMYVVDELFGIDVYATTRDELTELIGNQIELLWSEQAGMEQARLSDHAKRQLAALRKAVTVEET